MDFLPGLRKFWNEVQPQTQRERERLTLVLFGVTLGFTLCGLIYLILVVVLYHRFAGTLEEGVICWTFAGLSLFWGGVTAHYSRNNNTPDR